jgi:anti-repressor protein
MQESEIQVRVQQEVERFISNPDNVIEAYQKSLTNKEAQIADLRPKAEFWETAMGSDRLTEMAAVAKILNFRDMGRNNLFEYLREKSVLRESNEPYQKYVDSGYFKVIEQTIKTGSYTIINNKTMVTQKGLDFIRKMLKGDDYVSVAR